MARDKYAVVHHVTGRKAIMLTRDVKASETELQAQGYTHAESGFATQARALAWALTGGWPNVTPNHPN